MLGLLCLKKDQCGAPVTRGLISSALHGARGHFGFTHVRAFALSGPLSAVARHAITLIADHFVLARAAARRGASVRQQRGHRACLIADQSGPLRR